MGIAVGFDEGYEVGNADGNREGEIVGLLDGREVDADSSGAAPKISKNSAAINNIPNHFLKGIYYTVSLFCRF